MFLSEKNFIDHKKEYRKKITDRLEKNILLSPAEKQFPVVVGQIIMCHVNETLFVTDSKGVAISQHCLFLRHTRKEKMSAQIGL